ncbi:uncharacterized protein LOC117121169 [Anneissia japonica]|uniref:uncharacterized protein LOC117121169 n=1 Tax=Anneissia japonica TaxID=1529436 RepID=UPI0014255656|nr:uncharacterized protein LOC117121169 [Anneissia japonica]
MTGHIEAVMLLLPLFLVTYTRVASTPTLPQQGVWSYGQCIKMTFGARLTIPYKLMDGRTAELDIDVPYQADSESSHCNSQVATFLLKFFPNPNQVKQHWEFSLTFKSYGDTYKIENATVQFVIDDHFPITAQHGGQWYRQSTSSFNTIAATGSYIDCEKVEYKMGINGLTVSLFYAKMQPFSHGVPDNGYGTRGPCLTYIKEDVATKSGPSKIAVVCTLLLIMMIVAAIVGTVFYMRKKRGHSISYQRN